MTTEATDILTARALAATPAVAAAIDTIVGELTQAQASITAVRPASPDLAESYEAFLARQGAAKGRPPLYRYVGSGLGNGPLVQLADGSVKWDLINGIGVHMFGHGDPDLVATALRASLGDTVMQGNLQFNADVIEFAEVLLEQAGKSSGIKHCFTINAGALANESALKICCQKNAPADRVLAFAGAFAGRTMAMIQVGDSAAGRVGLPNTLQVDYVPFYDADRPDESTAETLRAMDEAVERYPGRYACFAMELVQGEGGFNVAPREFLETLMQRCRELGIGVWVDEIQTFGRCGEMFYFQQLDLGEYVDVVTIGKMSQVCACLFTADYAPQPGLLSATFVGSTVALQVGRRMIERLRDGGYWGPDGRIAQLHTAFRQHMDLLIKDHPEWFGPITLSDGRTSTRLYDGVGGMMRFTPFGGVKQKVLATLRRMFEAGVIGFYCGRGPFHIRFLPPVGVMEPRHFDDVFTILSAALAQAAEDD